MSNHRKQQTQTRGAQFNTGKMPCPNCNSQMELPFDRLFSGAPIWCSRCGAQLSVRLEESREALQALKRAQSMVEGLRSVK